MDIIWIVIVGLGVLLLVCIAILARRIKQQNRQLSEAWKKIDSLTENLNALCSGAVGVDQRVSRLERQRRDIQQRQESIENQRQMERPYGAAIQLVHQGATADRLVDELGLSRSEADLVVMLHGAEQVN